jgi:hypothetical protein
MALNWILPILGFALNRRLQGNQVAEIDRSVDARLEAEHAAQAALIGELRATVESMASAHASECRALSNRLWLTTGAALAALIVAVIGLLT